MKFYGILLSGPSYDMSCRFFFKPALSNKCINTTFIIKTPEKS